MTGHTISPLVRTSLMVRDLERSRRFYQLLLGLTDVYLPTADLTQTIAWKLLGIGEGRPYKGTILKVPGPNNGMVGLFEIGGEYDAEVVPPKGRIALGETIQVFYSANLDYILENVSRFGGTIIAPPERFFIEGSAMTRPITEVVLRDPDGFAVSLNDEDPSMAYSTDPISFG